jgi:hypothetical protein
VGGTAGDVDHASRYYDARSRQAVRRCAGWLRLPRRQLLALEALLAVQGEGSPTPAPYELPTHSAVDWKAAATDWTLSAASQITTGVNRSVALGRRLAHNPW